MRNISKPVCIESPARPSRWWHGRWPAAMLLTGAMITAALAAPAATGRVATVTIENMKFSPGVVNIRPGDQVVFVNKDLVPHTATAKANGTFNSGIVQPGQTWTFRAQSPGAIPYACTLHPTMEGEIVVTKP